MKILIIEDQENLAKLIKKGLESEGFAADFILDGQAGQNRINMHHKEYDLIILDLMLPSKNGMEICQESRAQNINIPIIMLTAKNSPADIVSGLNAGADDYLAKPFSFEMLLARIRAVMRRPSSLLPSEFKVGDLSLNPATKKVRCGKKEIKLTLKEFSLLEYFMRHPGEVMSREQILSSVWDFEFDSFANVIDVHLLNLRKKIGDKEGKVIETVRGMGYRLNA